MKRPYTQKELHEFGKATTFLCKWLNHSSTNPKPVIWHSIRVAYKLSGARVPSYAVVAALLHDLLEDTKCKPAEIQKEFGAKVLKLVQVLTYDNTAEYKKNWAELLPNKILPSIVKAGKWAMVIKVADNMDNFVYAKAVNSNKIMKEIMWRHKLFIKVFAPYLRTLPMFKAYRSLVNSS